MLHPINIGMKLIEIIGREDLRKYLSKLDREGAADELISFHGFERMKGARGAYSSVLTSPRAPYIIKLFDANDVGYMRFLDVALANQSNPHFPRIRGRPMRIGPRIMGIRLERLEPMSRGEYEEIEYMLHSMSTNPAWERSLRPGDSHHEFLVRWPEFSSAIALLRRAISNDVGFDWHGGNMMKRGETPVIIDPFEVRLPDEPSGSMA